MLGALISVGGSLLGGILGNNSEKRRAAQERAWALEDQAEQFTRLRAAAEKGGFNPLTALGAAPNSGMPRGTDAASGNYMGTAIADSAMILADNYAKTQAAKQASKVEALKAQNAQLNKQLTQATLRPKVPGIYGGANGQAGSLVSVADQPNGAGLRGLPDRVAADPRREVDNLPIPSDGGVIRIDNPHAPPFNVPAVNGEVLDIWQLPVIGIGYAGTRLMEWYTRTNPTAPYGKLPGKPAPAPAVPGSKAAKTIAQRYNGGLHGWPQNYSGNW